MVSNAQSMITSIGRCSLQGLSSQQVDLYGLFRHEVALSLEEKESHRESNSDCHRTFDQIAISSSRCHISLLSGAAKSPVFPTHQSRFSTLPTTFSVLFTAGLLRNMASETAVATSNLSRSSERPAHPRNVLSSRRPTKSKTPELTDSATPPAGTTKAEWHSKRNRVPTSTSGRRG
ncbi:hypothetical protein BR93DRAFT_358282 [Coniochaeta sp. PMI_546]|nr:hypothetical protein BR93DRAFT_358282 [Coniochaeta sp. PMI_546]